MAQNVKKRERRIYSLHNPGRQTLWESMRIEETFQAMLTSPAARSAKRGLPVLLTCLTAAQGQLAGGSSPFAPALLAAMMMRGHAVGYAAAGCILGALIRSDPAMLLACLLMYVLYACLRSVNLRPNDLTCVIAVGIAVCFLPLLFAQSVFDGLMTAAGAVAAMVLAGTYAAALRIRLRERELLSAEEIISLMLLAAGILTGLRRMVIFGVSPVISVMFLMGMAAGYLGGAGLGAAVGALNGLLLGVTEPMQPHMLAGMVLVGLLGGVFSRMGRLWTAAAVPVAAILAGAMDEHFFTWAHTAELAAAMIAFLCVRKADWQRLRVFVDKEAQVRQNAELVQGGLHAELAQKIREYAALYDRMARRSAGGGSGQFSAVSTALERMAEELSQEVRPLPELSREIAQELDKAGIRAECVQAQKTGERLRVRMHLACKRRDGLCDLRTVQAASQAAGVPLRARPSGVCPKEGLCVLELEESYRYEASVGCASCSPEEEQPCGDTLTAVQLPEGKYLLALADGMGHGGAAQEESRAAVDLMEDFLLARFEPEAALHGVNELMLNGCSDEKFSTMDLALIDLTSGEMKAMKIGAVPSFVRRGKRIIRISGDALPMGVVERVKPSVTQLQLQDGDVLVMLSDGVLDAVGGDEEWLQAELLAIDARAPEASAQRLIARARAVGRHEDDMTVCILRLVRRLSR